MTDTTGRYAPMPEPGDVRASGGIVHSDGNVFFTNIEKMGSLLRAFAEATHALRAAQPIDMILYCPSCGVQHVDKPEGQFYPGHTAEESAAVNKDHGLWDNPPHRSHLCHACGCIWRPADVPTNGVESIKTEGKADTWPAQAAQRPADSWRDAVQDELTTLHLSCPDDPRQAIKDMIEWNVRIALDPTVSSDAQALIERGRQEAQRPAAPAPQDDRAAGFGSCDVCGKGLRYGERHTTCGAAVENAVKAALASRPVPPPIRDDEAEDLIDAANRKFNAYRSSIRGQQLTVLDDWKHWLIREVIAARDAQWKGGM